MKRTHDTLAATGGRYVHVDLNAGEGRNLLVGCKGTPMVFLDAAENHGLSDYLAYFVDRDPDAIERLIVRTPISLDLFRAPKEKHLCIVSDNAGFLRTFEDRLRMTRENQHNSTGSLLCDPNGIAQSGRRGGFPLYEIGQLAARMPRWLILIHWNYAAACRTAGYKRRHPGRPMSTMRLEDIFMTIRRPHWLISRGFGGHSVLCGSAEWMPGHPAGLFTLGSPEGQKYRRIQFGESTR